MSGTVLQIHPANCPTELTKCIDNCDTDATNSPPCESIDQTPCSGETTLRIIVSNAKEQDSTPSDLEEERDVPKEQAQSQNNSSLPQKKGGVESAYRTLRLARAWAKKSNQPETTEQPRVDSFLERLEMAGPSHDDVSTTSFPLNKHWVVDPSKPFLYRWQVVVFFAVLYNWIFIIARASFRDLHERYLAAWLILDYTCDIVYILDMVVQFRTGKGELD